jgi:hypothetical protein
LRLEEAVRLEESVRIEDAPWSLDILNPEGVLYE